MTEAIIVKLRQKLLFAAFAAGVAGMTLAGCQKKEGPAEAVGAKIDHAVDQAKEKVEHATDQMTSNEGPAQKAGEKIDEAAGEVGKKMQEVGKEIQQKADQ